MSTTNEVDVSRDMPHWLRQRIVNLGLTQPHYEASFGGPHNAMLQCFFPLEHSFMVKPIPRIRPPPAAVADDPFGNVDGKDEASMSQLSYESYYSREDIQSSPPARISIDSPVQSPTGTRRSIDSARFSMQSGHSNHSSNDSADDHMMAVDIESGSSDSYRPGPNSGHSDGSVAAPLTHVSYDSYNQIVSSGSSYSTPDFLVVKATEALNNDHALLIWELKRNDADHERSITQRARYETWAKLYQEFHLKNDGVMPFISVGLVEQDMVTIRTLDDEGEVKERMLNVLDPQLDELLRKIADVQKPYTEMWLPSVRIVR